MAGILTLQLKSIYGDKETNLKKVKHYIKFNSSKRLDLVVIPEFFATSTGYKENIEPEDGGETIKTICELAKEYNTNIIAGSVVRQKSDGKFYNTSFAINRMGEVIETYDKIHLWNYMGGSEGNFTTAGNEIKISHFDFAKVGMSICFDIRYPMMYKELAKKGADIIVLPTAWLVPKELYESESDLKVAKEMWQSMNKIRAFDNMVYFVVSNQTKDISDSMCGIGNSMVISPSGQIMGMLDDKEGAFYTNIDMEVLKMYRQLFPIAKLD